jgi:hypothetical protein
VGVKGVAKGCWAVGSRSGGPLLGVAQASADGVMAYLQANGQSIVEGDESAWLEGLGVTPEFWSRIEFDAATANSELARIFHRVAEVGGAVVVGAA